MGADNHRGRARRRRASRANHLAPDSCLSDSFRLHSVCDHLKPKRAHGASRPWSAALGPRGAQSASTPAEPTDCADELPLDDAKLVVVNEALLFPLDEVDQP